MVKKTLIVALFSLTLGLVCDARVLKIHASGKTSTRWEIEVRGSASVAAKDQPVEIGSVLVFHRYPDGALTGIPIEDVVAVNSTSPARVLASADTAAVTATRPIVPLQPGDLVVIGPTGGNSSPSAAEAAAAAAGRPYSPSAGGGPPSPSSLAARDAIEAQVFPGELPGPGAGMTTGSQQIYISGQAVLPATPRPLPPTSVDSNGFPSMGTGPQPINPNGFPAPTTRGPQSGTQPVSPNGFPATTGGAQSGVQSIDTNGFPTLNSPPVRQSPATGGATGSRASTTSRASGQIRIVAPQNAKTKPAAASGSPASFSGANPQ